MNKKSGGGGGSYEGRGGNKVEYGNFLSESDNHH